MKVGLELDEDGEAEVEGIEEHALIKMTVDHVGTKKAALDKEV